MPLVLRPATADDIAQLKAWDEKPHLQDIGGDDDWYDWDKEVPRDADWGELLIAELNGRAIGALEIIDPAREPTHYWGEIARHFRATDIWIGEADCLGKGYGEEMMRQAFDRCFAAPDVEAILIDPLESNVRAQRFYRRLGFDFVEKRRFENDHCVVYRLDRVVYEARYQRAS